MAWGTGLLLVLAAATVTVTTRAFRVVGQYDGVTPSVDAVPWHLYTHVRYGAPTVGDNGTCTCNRTLMATVVATAHRHGTAVLWAPGGVDNTSVPTLIHRPDDPFTRTYMATIAHAMDACDVDGLEIDYEHGPNRWGVVLPDDATRYTVFLATLRRITHRPVSADVSIWGVAPGNYVLGVLPWVNVSMLNAGAFDFVNTMSYHWNRDGMIDAWEKDVFFAVDVWGMDPGRVSLGLPYYTHPSQHPWGTVSPACPHVEPTVNTCGNQVFVGKAMNYAVGRLAADHALGGVFPWALSYDAFDNNNNNTLVPYLYAGYTRAPMPV